MEIISIVASFLVLVSMLVKTTSYKGTIFMRVFNTIGSVVFIFYGLFGVEDSVLPSVIIMNIAIIGVNVFYIIKEYRDHKKIV